MPHRTIKLEHGPVTYDVGVDTVIGGRLVEIKADGTIKHTTAATAKCIGMAQDDAQPLTGQAVDGYNVTSAIVRSSTAIAYRGIARLLYAAAAGCGDRLVAAADGKVIPFAGGTHTFDQVVGRCLEPNGVLINTLGRSIIETI